MDQIDRLLLSIAKATMVPSMVAIKQIKNVRESWAGYDFSVIAYKASINFID